MHAHIHTYDVLTYVHKYIHARVHARTHAREEAECSCFFSYVYMELSCPMVAYLSVTLFHALSVNDGSSEVAFIE
jgi:hypothetical protein